MESLRNKFLRLLNTVTYTKKRFLFNTINWNDRLIVIKGQRGTGKTTVVLQHIKTYFTKPDQLIYISLDDIYFSDNNLSDFVDEFAKNDGKYLFIDEVHRYKGWSREIKNIYDFYPDIQLIITGSSAIDFYINSSDLGRRSTVYNLPELSFREFLDFEYDIKIEPFTLSDIIQNHEKTSLEINSKIKSLKLFKKYLQTGAYPFSSADDYKYFEKLEAIINTVINNDIPAVENIKYESRKKLLKLLFMMANNSPFKVNISELSRRLETSRDVLSKLLNLLNMAGLIKTLSTDGLGNVIFRKPDKLYFSNTNLIYAISTNINIGNIRETFFLNQLSQVHDVSYPKTGDFIVDKKYTFEIGGKNKTIKQVSDIQDSFIAADDIEYGYKNKIPIWMFGFLY
ncbi:MAG: AAA family ATPase [Chlorobi bacterium]|nr:AAA family ATPase [Chlorobiota bacterium]